MELAEPDSNSCSGRGPDVLQVENQSNSDIIRPQLVLIVPTDSNVTHYVDEDTDIRLQEVDDPLSATAVAQQQDQGLELGQLPWEIVKVQPEAERIGGNTTITTAPDVTPIPAAKRGRGRPRKYPPVPISTEKKKRGPKPKPKPPRGPPLSQVPLDPLTCKFCPEPPKFDDAVDLARHYTTQHIFSKVSGLVKIPKKTVKNSTTHVEPCICPHCNLAYATSNFLDQHIATRHNHSEPTSTRRPRHLCPEEGCGRKYGSKPQLQVHIKSVHKRPKKVKPDPNRIICPTCGQSCSKDSFYAHRETHLKDRQRFYCATCGVGYFRSSDLKIHQRKHDNEKRFSCPHPGCEWKFHRAHGLKIHMLTHTGKPHACGECGQRFTVMHGLMVHKERHRMGRLSRTEPECGRKPRKRNKEFVEEGGGESAAT